MGLITYLRFYKNQFNIYIYDSIKFKLSQCEPKANNKFTLEFLLKTMTDKQRYQENKSRKKITRCRRHFHKDKINDTIC